MGVFEDTYEESKKRYAGKGVGPLILGKLKGAILNAKVARELLKKTPRWAFWDRLYYKHVIEEGERARKALKRILGSKDKQPG